MCESNVCGNYGRNYTCPPDAGDITELMKKIRTHNQALIYQTVGALEDSYDFEGMMEAAAGHNRLAQSLWDVREEMQLKDINVQNEEHARALMKMAEGYRRIKRWSDM